MRRIATAAFAVLLTAGIGVFGNDVRAQEQENTSSGQPVYVRVFPLYLFKETPVRDIIQILTHPDTVRGTGIVSFITTNFELETAMEFTAPEIIIEGNTIEMKADSKTSNSTVHRIHKNREIYVPCLRIRFGAAIIETLPSYDSIYVEVTQKCTSGWRNYRMERYLKNVQLATALLNNCSRKLLF